MGRYIDWADIAGRYVDVTKIGGAEAVASHWISYSEADIDARLAVAFTTPFSPAPDVIKDLCIDMAYYRMTMRQKNSEVIKAFIDERLTGLINGTIVINASSPNDGVLAWGEQNQTGYHTAFGPDGELNWTPSSAFIQDVQDQR